MEKKIELLWPIYEFRPDVLAESCSESNLLRWNNGNPIPDDGEFDIAFIGGNFVFYVDLPYYANLLWKWCKGMQWGDHVSSHPNGNAWHYVSRDGSRKWGDHWARDSHPNTIAGSRAMNYLSKQRSCANGRSVEFNVTDKTITEGLLRIRETREIVKPPEIFQCMYCGNLDWHEEEQLLLIKNY